MKRILFTLILIKDIDRYGRIVAEVAVNGKSLNRELLRNGYAWWYRKYSDDGSLGRLESAAKKSKRGLWRDSRAVAPWEWRGR